MRNEVIYYDPEDGKNHVESLANYHEIRFYAGLRGVDVTKFRVIESGYVSKKGSRKLDKHK